jgi:hypothetical protein
MQAAESWDSIKELRELRNQGYKSDEVALNKWHDIHARLSEARRQAEEYAYAAMDRDVYAQIQQRQIERDERALAAQKGTVFEQIRK